MQRSSKVARCCWRNCQRARVDRAGLPPNRRIGSGRDGGHRPGAFPWAAWRRAPRRDRHLAAAIAQAARPCAPPGLRSLSPRRRSMRSAGPPSAPRTRRADEETAQRPEPASMAGDGNLGAQSETQGPRRRHHRGRRAGTPARRRPGPQRDARTAEDIAAFEGPPAGYNPYLYQIELQPLTDRRTLELFRLEPYVARGIRVGSFVIFPEAEFGALVSDNVFRSPSRHADDAFEARSTVRVVSDWRAHAVEFRASGLASFYRELATEDDRAYALEARARLDLTKRTNIEALVLHQRRQGHALRTRCTERRRTPRRHRDRPRRRRPQPSLQPPEPAAQGHRHRHRLRPGPEHRRQPDQ